MKLEDSIFNNYKANSKKLLAYGFTKGDSNYTYNQFFHNKKFKAVISISFSSVSGKVIDCELNEEYLSIHTDQIGKFVDTIRNEYIEILKDIRKNCFRLDLNKVFNQKNSWLIPANPKYYDIMHAFDKTDTIIWKQSTHIKVNDIVFVYVGAPVSAIIYTCQVLEIDIPYEYKTKDLQMTNVMKIKKLKSYPQDKFTFKKLRNYDVRAIRGPRHLPEKLLKVLTKEFYIIR